MTSRGKPDPSVEEIYKFFGERMWRPYLVAWVGWPGALACFLGSLISLFGYRQYLFGAVLFLIAAGVIAWLIKSTLERRREWMSYIETSVAQIERDFRRLESTLCLVQRMSLGFCDRLLLVKRTDLHFKGYFMSPWQVRRLGNAFGIGYVESSRIISGVLPLSRIKQFTAHQAIRRRYIILAIAGLGLGAAFLLRSMTGAEHGVLETLAMVLFFLAGIAGLVLAFVHRQPEVIIHTDQYGLHVAANQPNPDAVLHFLRRIGYREIRAPSLPRTSQSN